MRSRILRTMKPLDYISEYHQDVYPVEDVPCQSYAVVWQSHSYDMGIFTLHYSTFIFQMQLDYHLGLGGFLHCSKGLEKSKVSAMDFVSRPSLTCALLVVPTEESY